MLLAYKQIVKVKVFIVALLLLLIFVLPVCGGGTGEGTKDRIVVGLSMQEMSEFLTALTDACIEKAEELDVELRVANAEGKIEKQVNDLEDFISQEVDVIILSAIDMVALNNAVDMIADSGIPLVELNTMTTNQRFTTYSGSEEVQAGRLQGEYVRKRLGGDNAKGKVLILEGVIGHIAQVERNRGFYEALVDYPGSQIEVLEEVPVEHWSREGAMYKMQDYLRVFPQIDAVLSVSDQMSLGAIQAIVEAGRKDEIIVCGTDAMPDALVAIKEGKMDCSIFQDSKAQARNAVEAAVKIANGEKVEKLLWVPFELVTIDNVDEYIGRNE